MPEIQRRRVLAALQQLGTDGVTQADFLPPTIDGGPTITRLGARVHELRAAGHAIEPAGRRDRCRVYVLERPR